MSQLTFQQVGCSMHDYLRVFTLKNTFVFHVRVPHQINEASRRPSEISKKIFSTFLRTWYKMRGILQLTAFFHSWNEPKSGDYVFFFLRRSTVVQPYGKNLSEIHSSLHDDWNKRVHSDTNETWGHPELNRCDF